MEKGKEERKGKKGRRKRKEREREGKMRGCDCGEEDGWREREKG